ncbi:MAG TPA: alkaline phosphatase family protein [Steroidobacteraceae bacterium]|jgi:phospholipase C|nr:alkaline phosphatase family protein [Steroidobacteraceae bacterium]
MTDSIEHVIVLMLENRAFDHVLGDCAKIKSKLGHAPDGVNQYSGSTYPQRSGAARQVVDDPDHDTSDVLVQLQGFGSVTTNGGFVLDYARNYPSLADPGEVMRYHAEGTLPAIQTLAATFTVCDRWHASVPGPTWPNRLFAMSGTSLGRVKMPSGIMSLNLHWYDQPTVFDRLNEQRKDWRVYFGDVPMSLLLVHQWDPENAARHLHMTDFYKDAAGDANDFPAFALIEPSYLSPGANDAHPPHDIVDADVLVARVYNAIRSNEELWASSLLVVLFDEHGGFYDPVQPPAAIPPDHHVEEYTFTQYGVRVPAILVSPFAANGFYSEVLDHTSLLKYLQDKWGLGDLGARTASAKSVAPALQGKSVAAVLPGLQVARSAGPPAITPTALSDHQSALVALSQHLEAMTDEDPNVVAARSRQVLSGPQSQIDVAVDRVEAFIAQQKTRVNAGQA